MKIIIISFCVLYFSVHLNAQITIDNIENAVSISVLSGSTPNDPTVYQWQEYTNIKQGVNISVVPTEVATIYLQENNSYINFDTWNWGLMTALWVNYDNAGWQLIFLNQTKNASGWLAPPFSTLGSHTISVKWIALGETVYIRDYNVIITSNPI